jgi:hypothetical protein
MDYDVVIAGSGGGGLTPGVTIWTKTAVEHLTFDGGRAPALSRTAPGAKSSFMPDAVSYSRSAVVVETMRCGPR